MTEPVYKELFELYANHRSAISNSIEKAHFCARELKEKLLEKTGLPKDGFTINGGLKYWVQTYNIDEDGEVTEQPIRKLDIWTDDGELRFAVGLALSHELDSFPKSYFYITYLAKPKEESVEVWAAHNPSKKYQIKTATDLNTVADDFIDGVRNGLSRSIYEEDKRSGIGFLAN